jgi:large subunit ribosomal protein L21e
MARKGGVRRNKRALYSKNIKSKGKISLRNYLKEYSVGERVNLTLEPSILEGQYHTRFVGKSGIVNARQGDCYLVQIKDFDKEKQVLVHPIHMRRSK